MFKLIGRIVLDILLIISVIQGWWYFALLLGIIGVWNFGFFIEIIIAGFLYDSLFGPIKQINLNGSVGLIAAAVLFIVLVIAKKLVRIRD